MADWEANVRRVVPYTPGEQPKRNDIIKLNTNECPYPPAPGVTKALQEFEADKLRLYPDPAALELREAIAAAVSVSEHPVAADQVFVGVGSDDVLALAFLTFFNSKKPILFPDITYSFYDVWADLYGIPYRTPGLDERFRLKKEDYLNENGGIIFPNPNAPTGLMENLDTIEEIVAKNPDSVVIVDEAYVDFGGVSALPLVDKYENLLVVQTFSKSRALAGMRIGFAIGQKKLISYLNDVKFSFNSYTMNRLTIACGKACVDEPCVFSGDYGENRGDAGMDEAEADRAWLYVPGFEGELYFCNAQNRPGAGVIREPENSRNLCAIFQKAQNRQLSADYSRHAGGDGAAGRSAGRAGEIGRGMFENARAAAENTFACRHRNARGQMQKNAAARQKERG